MPVCTPLFGDAAIRATLLGALLMLASASALAQNSDGAAFDSLEWTGRPESAAIARKEAAAALAEGRRECARQRGDRAACLKQVQDDYTASLRRLGGPTAKR